MSHVTDYASSKMINHLLGKEAFTMPDAIYIALYTVSPTGSSTGTEVSASGYARKALTLSKSAGGSASTNTATVAFGPAGADWGTVVAAALLDASTGGNMLVYTAIPAMVISSGDIPTIPIGSMSAAQA